MTNRLSAFLESRYRISAQLYLGIGGAVLVTMAASLVGLFSFNRVADAQARVSEESVPEVVAAFGVAQYSATLVNAAPNLISSETPDELSQVSTSIDATREEMELQLAALEERLSGDDRFDLIRNRADVLFLNIEAIEAEMSELFDVFLLKEAFRVELELLSNRIDRIVIPEADNQLFFTVTGYYRLGEPPVPSDIHFSEVQFLYYRHLSVLQTEANIAAQLLATAFTLSTPALLEPLRERFESTVGRVEQVLNAVQEFPIHSQVEQSFLRLFELGTGEQSAFNLVERELRIADRQRGLLGRNREVALELVAGVDGLVGTANADVQGATLASEQAVATGRTLLTVISGVSVVSAILIAWLYVGRVLIRRLGTLSERMRSMAGGDLEAEVEIGGRDEVADMAAALEVFRRHALEVQRLNLVEKLADELQGKNEQLESVLGELRHAQDQIVMREKLAALGELTAGVAHEIRNPLNFVKNFSEASEELLDEMKEVLEEGKNGDLASDNVSYIQEISEDLVGNLGRIRQHSERANRIVQDMLMMGRGGSDLHSTDLNLLLNEYARLAYHSARATDPDFQLHLDENFDPEVGELEVVPQDLGRVFLNMVGNACYATDEKRKAIAEAGPDAGPYNPTLSLSTSRGEDSVVFTIKDNGNGMPPEVIERIFNPFFTTKPAGQGTGLGLAMSSDIVREHGGTIRVESDPGEYTSMIVELPLTRPEKSVELELEVLGEGATTEQA